MNERHIQTAAARESYCAPNYDVFVFESSDLILASGDTPTPTVGKGFLGVASADRSSINPDEDW